MKWLLERLSGFAYAAVLVIAFLGLMQCMGCATYNGVQMNDEEAAACKAEGCAVFTANELRTLVTRALEAGYRKGWVDALAQSAKDL